MSASRTLLLASRSKQEESDEDYDSEEERYQRDRQRLFRDVEKSAAALRALSQITRPYTSGKWREEKDERYLRNEELSVANFVKTLIASKENKPHSAAPAVSKDEVVAGTAGPVTDMASESKRKSIWQSPVSYVNTNNMRAVLEMEKSSTWTPLRKSKARQSLANFNLQSAICDVDNDVSSLCKALPESEIATETSVREVDEHRTPLKVVETPNQASKQQLSEPQAIASEATSLVSDAPEFKETAALTHNCQGLEASGLNLHDSVESVELSQTPSKPSSQDSIDGEILTKTQKFVKSFKSPVRSSPILRQAFGEEFAIVRGSIGSPDKLVNLEECTSPKDPSKVLKGVVAYVEARSGEDDRTGGFRWKLGQLGATVSDTLNKKVTHCVFQEGLLSTFRKAKQIGAHIVSPHWVMACDESYSHIQESRYPIDKLSQYELADPLLKCIKRPKIMSPDLGSGRDEKLLARRKQRRSMKLNSPLVHVLPHTTSVFKTPSPLKPKSLFSESELDDDGDGFLAMVVAKVREKAQAQRKAGELNGTIVDFETRLKQLLGREEAQHKEAATPPLASIFQRGKASNPMPVKTTSKKAKKAKLGLEPGASSLVMMNWLKRRSPNTGHTGDKETDLSSAAIAASAAADEILKAMYQSKKFEDRTQTQNDKEKKTKTADVALVNPAVCKKTNSIEVGEAFVLTASSKSTKAAVPVKKPSRNSKLNFQGSEASSGAMCNWLSGIKSPPPCETSTYVLKISSQTPEEKSPKATVNKKRKNKSCEEVFHGDSFEESTNPCKKLCREATPKKTEPSCFENKLSEITASLNLALESTTKSSSTKTKRNQTTEVNLTPRRRSLRLTPVKNASQAGSITQLETVEECKESSCFNVGMPRKESVSSSSKSTPIKETTPRTAFTSSKKSGTPSKHTKSTKSDSKRGFTAKSNDCNSIFG